MRFSRTRILAVAVAGVLAWGSSSLAQSASATATWVDKSDNEQGFRVIQVVPNVTPRPIACEVGTNVQTCQFNMLDSTRRCFVAVAFNGDGPSPDSPQACTGTPSAPGTFKVIVTTTTTVAGPEPPALEIE